MLKRIFKYFEPAWTGADGKISLRAVLAIAFSIDFIRNLSYAVIKWGGDRSLEGLALVLGIEAGLIAALLTLTTYQNVQSGLNKIVETTATEPQTVKTTTEAKGVQAVEQVKEQPPLD